MFMIFVYKDRLRMGREELRNLSVFTTTVTMASPTQFYASKPKFIFSSDYSCAVFFMWKSYW
jgi:hypothetical protein